MKDAEEELTARPNKSDLPESRKSEVFFLPVFPDFIINLGVGGYFENIHFQRVV
ncbi:MAG: hypothetical protein MZV64_01595 [Ignavibacteriales bacterium]|nr:hypothetical protein [Ignavibacteriales bacterium]